MEQRVAIPTVLNGALGAGLLALLLMIGFRDRYQMLWTLLMLLFGSLSTYRLLAPKFTSQVYADPWLLHFILQPFTWIAIAAVITALLIWGNQEGWAMIALGYLLGSRVAFLVEGLQRLSD